MMPHGEAGFQPLSYQEILEQPRDFALVDAQIEEYKGLCDGYDAYNPSGEVDGQYLLRVERRHGMFKAFSYDNGRSFGVEGEDPGLYRLGGLLVARVVRPEWPSDMDDSNFDINRATRVSTVWYSGNHLDDMSPIAAIEGKPYVPVDVGSWRLGCYTRPQADIRRVSVGYVEANSLIRLLTPETLASAQTIGGGVFQEGTGGGVNGAHDMGDGHNLLIMHAAQDLDTPVPAGSPKACEYVAALGLHERASGKVYNLGVIATRADWPWDPSDTKYPGRENVVYPGGMHNVHIDERGHLVGAARAGLSDCRHGVFRFESKQPYSRIVQRLHQQ